MVHSPQYLGSQPWPFPQSLMLGFSAITDDPGAAVADGEEIGRARADQLLERYGTRATDVIEHLLAGSDEPVALAPDYSRREIELLAADEQVVHLIDVVLRRTSLGFVGGLSRPLISTLAEIVGGVLDWGRERRDDEIDATIRELHDAHGVELSDNEIREEVATR